MREGLRVLLSIGGQMKNALERIERKIDQIDAKIDALTINDVNMSKDVAQNTRDLTEHIRRTNLLETKILKVQYLILFVLGMAAAVGWPYIKIVLGILI